MKMRFAFALLALVLGAGAGCYSPPDLGEDPFLCSKDQPQCPDNYVCDLTNQTGKCPVTGKCVCVRAALTVIQAAESSASTMSDDVAATQSRNQATQAPQQALEKPSVSVEKVVALPQP